MDCVFFNTAFEASNELFPEQIFKASNELLPFHEFD